MANTLFRLCLLVTTVCLMIDFTSARACCSDTCQCNDHIINCNDKGLHDIPVCTDFVAGDVYTKLTISKNNITALSLSTLEQFNKLINISEVDASDNTISVIHTTPGSTYLSRLQILNLRNNSLIRLDDIIDIPHLIDLDVSENPIEPASFSAHVMRELGSTLQRFHIGHPVHLTRWPQDISDHLQRLDSLEINTAAVMFQYLPPGAFKAFQYRLQNLTIRNTHMQSIPLAIHTLPSLEELHFDDNPVGDYGVLPESFAGLEKLSILTLKRDSLTTFPQIVDHLPSLTSLSLDGNRLLFIREKAIDMINASNIRTLSLASCSLARVPGAIGYSNVDYLDRLEHLNMAGNNIQSVDRNDLHDLANLATVSFADNPLQYVSSEAFRNLPKLMSIDLSNTSLRVIPIALEHVARTDFIVDLTNTNVECTCDLVDIKRFFSLNHVDVSIKGSCETIHSEISHYLDTTVPKCPNYSLTVG